MTWIVIGAIGLTAIAVLAVVIIGGVVLVQKFLARNDEAERQERPDRR